jgi:hypothetical protein
MSQVKHDYKTHLVIVYHQYTSAITLAGEGLPNHVGARK